MYFSIFIILTCCILFTSCSGIEGEWVEMGADTDKNMEKYEEYIVKECDDNGYDIEEIQIHDNLYYCSTVNPENGLIVEINIYVDDEDNEDVYIASINDNVELDNSMSTIKLCYDLVIPIINRFSDEKIEPNTIDAFLDDELNQIKDSDDGDMLKRKKTDNGVYCLEYNLYYDETGNNTNEKNLTEVLILSTKYDEY